MDTPKTNTHRALRFCIILLYIVMLLLPGYTFFSDRGGFAFFDTMPTAEIGALLLFPVFGLYAYTFLWIQFMTGSSMSVIRPLLPWMYRAHRMHGVFVLLFALTHPLLLIAGIGLDQVIQFTYVTPELRVFAWLGIAAIGTILLIVATALLMRRPFLRKYWRAVHLLSYAAIWLVWFHAWFIGTDVQHGALRWFWLFTGASVLAASALRLFRAWKVHQKKQLYNSQVAIEK